MRLTLTAVRRYVVRELTRQRIGGTLVSAEWIGKPTQERRGPETFRVARVVIALQGRMVSKLVTLDTAGGRMIQ